MRRFFLSLPILAALAFASCDDGSVTDPVYSDTTETYKALLVADLRGLDMWGSSYSVVLAGFSNDSRYSRIQKNLTSTGADDVLDSIVLAGIPTTATSIELAVVGSPDATRFQNAMATDFLSLIGKLASATLTDLFAAV